ncbi:Casein kinase I isoform delta-like [Aphelenchoides besseyi]|nr:Casein kinase I isoform delta-like [Aphelenchoides besseyi]
MKLRRGSTRPSSHDNYQTIKCTSLPPESLDMELIATFLKLLTDAKYDYSPRFCLFSRIYGIEPIILMELMGPDLGKLIDNPEVLKMSNQSIAVATRDVRNFYLHFCLFAFQMLSALNGMHELGFCVQDVKLENFCVVRAEDNSIVRVKLVDFGMTVGFKWTELRECDFQLEEVKSNSEICGTLPYIPRAGYVDTNEILMIKKLK